MITALIFAGGTGERMNSKTKPKQFLELHGKPILIHTIEYFEEHPMVDHIAVVCLDSWIEECYKHIERNFIHKVKWVVPGGDSGQESIFNGLQAIKEGCNEDTIVLIHDGVRPLISKQLITDNINAVKQHRSAITVSYATETIVTIDNNINIETIPNREQTRIAKAPQSFYFNDIWRAHLKAQEDGLHSMIDSATLMKQYGHTLHTVISSPYNIKITTPSDYYLFRAIYEAKENSQIFGL
ncbi:IspD/TarI family cytidylyltransferase [Paenibacillus arenosi]|uniref:2-C-methyl-D-erythritol 4-phosphate cytidylyltransferase n=1 Tax=Paenibacillus arenosi TaxID=2774142 RepID=A0ABR9AV59_9BACL|nr:IspD/TarI family cytidylyltransferase [Paenibacillus arenosi]MBD8497954.1 2-C-methyl-D-erythritol 4-phosphate cytidylyltransferase [Paenibacillus arenosi]